VRDLKAPVWGATAAGAAFGLWGGPLGVAIGAATGGVVDILRHEYHRRWAGWHPLSEHHMRGVRRGAPGAQDDVLQRQAAVAGAAPPKAAIDLQLFLDKYAAHRGKPQFWKAQTTIAAVAAFQRAYDADYTTSQSLGAITITGRFDPKTAAALTLYTHKSVSPDPAASEVS
jgi:hypothetical protein